MSDQHDDVCEECANFAENCTCERGEIYPSNATAFSASLVRLLETVDAYGNLMPSFLHTPASGEAKAAGLVEDVRTEHGPWQRLTVAGMERKFSLPNVAPLATGESTADRSREPS